MARSSILKKLGLCAKCKINKRTNTGSYCPQCNRANFKKSFIANPYYTLLKSIWYRVNNPKNKGYKDVYIEWDYKKTEDVLDFKKYLTEEIPGRKYIPHKEMELHRPKRALGYFKGNIQVVFNWEHRFYDGLIDVKTQGLTKAAAHKLIDENW